MKLLVDFRLMACLSAILLLSCLQMSCRRSAPAQAALCTSSGRSLVEVLRKRERWLCFGLDSATAEPDERSCLPHKFSRNDTLACGWDDEDTIWVSSVDI